MHLVASVSLSVRPFDLRPSYFWRATVDTRSSALQNIYGKYPTDYMDIQDSMDLPHSSTMGAPLLGR